MRACADPRFSCDLAGQLGVAAAEKSLQEFYDDAANLAEVDEDTLDDFLEQAVRTAINEGTETCSKLTHLAHPATVFPSKADFLAGVKNQSISIVGRQCHSPTIGITAEQRSMNPPKVRFAPQQ